MLGAANCEIWQKHSFPKIGGTHNTIEQKFEINQIQCQMTFVNKCRMGGVRARVNRETASSIPALRVERRQKRQAVGKGQIDRRVP